MNAAPSSWPYRIAMVPAAIVAAVAVAFFVIGVADGTVSSFNIVMWIGLLAVIGALLFAGIRLRASGRTKSAVVVLSILGLPGVLFALSFVVLVASGVRWN